MIKFRCRLFGHSLLGYWKLGGGWPGGYWHYYCKKCNAQATYRGRYLSTCPDNRNIIKRMLVGKGINILKL